MGEFVACPIDFYEGLLATSTVNSREPIWGELTTTPEVEARVVGSRSSRVPLGQGSRQTRALPGL